MEERDHFYVWVIKTKARHEWIFLDQHLYVANRTSLKNPKFLTGSHWKVKLFRSKAEADAHLMARASRRHAVEGLHLARKKLWVKREKRKLVFDYWKNRRVFV